MDTQQQTTVWSDNRKVSIRTSGNGQLDIRVREGWQFLSTSEFKQMVKALRKATR